MFGKELGIEERQLDRVPDLLDLFLKTAHVVVTDLWNLLQHELLGLGLGQLLNHIPRPRIVEQEISDAQPLADQRLPEFGNSLLIIVQGHKGAPAFENVL